MFLYNRDGLWRTKKNYFRFVFIYLEKVLRHPALTDKIITDENWFLVVLDFVFMYDMSVAACIHRTIRGQGWSLGEYHRSEGPQKRRQYQPLLKKL